MHTYILNQCVFATKESEKSVALRIEILSVKVHDY